MVLPVSLVKPVMFCPFCGKRMQILFVFCPSCGQKKDDIEVNSGVSSTNSTTVSSASSKTANVSVSVANNGRPVSFHNYMTKKAEERASYFRPSKKQRVSEKQEVTINIGVMELSKDGVSYILRGKTLPLKISKEADYKTLLESALKKRSI